MISVAPNVLEDISRRADDLKQTLLTEGTRRLPGFSAYAKALKRRVSADPSSDAAPSMPPSSARTLESK